jgi:hypothetical protein
MPMLIGKQRRRILAETPLVRWSGYSSISLAITGGEAYDPFFESICDSANSRVTVMGG